MKGSRGLKAYCKGGQGPPWAVAPLKKKKVYCDLTPAYGFQTFQRIMSPTSSMVKGSSCAP